MKKNTRITLFSLTILIVILAAVLIVRLSDRTAPSAPADPHCYIEGTVTDSSLKFAYLKHFSRKVVTKDILENGKKVGYSVGCEQIFDSVPIRNGKFRFKIWMNRPFIKGYVLLVGGPGQSKQDLMHLNTRVSERLRYNGIILDQGKKIEFQVTDSILGKRFRMANLRGGEATLMYEERVLYKQYASQAKVFNKKKLCDLKLLSGYKYNHYLLEKAYNWRNELTPDTLSQILNCFAEPLRKSETGKKLQSFIDQKKKAAQ